MKTLISSFQVLCKKKYILIIAIMYILYLITVLATVSFSLGDGILSFIAKHIFPMIYFCSMAVCLVVYFRNNSLINALTLFISTILLAIIATLILAVFDIRIPILSTENQLYVIERVKIIVNNAAFFLLYCPIITIFLFVPIAVSICIRKKSKT